MELILITLICAHRSGGIALPQFSCNEYPDSLLGERFDLKCGLCGRTRCLTLTFVKRLPREHGAGAEAILLQADLFTYHPIVIPAGE